MKLTTTRLKNHFDHMGFEPNETQEPIYEHMVEERFCLVAGGERAGKSRTAGEWCAAVAAHDLGPGLYWIVGAEYIDANPEFEVVFETLDGIGAVVKSSLPQQGSRSLETPNEVRVVTHSAHDPQKLGREAPDGILMCEAGRHSYESYLRLRGRVAEKRGWMWISGTFESSVGWYAQKYKEWGADGADGRSFSLPSWSNTAIYPGGREDEEIKGLEAEYPPDRFSERFAGVPVPPVGLVFKEFSFKEHVPGCEWVEGHPVLLWIDPGYAGAYCVLAVQIVGAGFVHVFDELYLTGRIDTQIIDACSTKLWWKDVEGGAIDIASRQRTTRSQRTTWDTWREKTGIALAYTQVGIVDGINAVRRFLHPNPEDGLPRLVISPRCKGLIGEMSGDEAEPFFGGYRYKVVDGQVISEIPEDRSNHACKALAYGLVNKFGTVDRRKRKKQRTKPLAIDRALSRAYSGRRTRRRY